MNHKKLPEKVPRMYSKKGLSLVELLVGVTIIAIAMASAAGTIVSGYKTTIDNAAKNQAAAESASLNEVIMKAIESCHFGSADDAEEHFDDLDDGANDGGYTAAAEPIYQAAKELMSDIHYISDMSAALNESYDRQYNLKIDAERTIEASGSANIVISGIEVTTLVAAPDGFVKIVSFVPYNEQD